MEIILNNNNCKNLRKYSFYRKTLILSDCEKDFENINIRILSKVFFTIFCAKIKNYLFLKIVKGSHSLEYKSELQFL